MRLDPRGMLHRFAAMGFLLLVVGGCHIKLVSEYDDNFVQAATSTQKAIGTLLQTLKNPPSGTDVTYNGNIATYNKIDVDINGLLVLASAHQNNDATIAQVNRLVSMVRDLESLHKKTDALSPAFLTQEQQDMNTAFTLVIRTENNKRAGL
jgi:hypothetical protein